MPKYTDEVTHELTSGWTLHVAGFRALHEEDASYQDEFGAGFLAHGYLVKGDRRIHVEAFPSRTLHGAVKSLVESSETDSIHLEERGW